MRERTVVGFTSFIKQQLERDHYVASIEDPAKRALAREETLAPGKAHHGCLLVGYLNVNRVPGNFHVLARSANHNMNPAMANLSHVVNHLQFGGLITKQVQRVMNRVPEDIFAGESALSPMDGNAYGTPGGLHKAYHHYLKLVSTHFNKGVYRGSRAIMVYQMLASDQVCIIWPALREHNLHSRTFVAITIENLLLFSYPRPLFHHSASFRNSKCTPHTLVYNLGDELRQR
jgi:hypothetical protein